MNRRNPLAQSPARGGGSARRLPWLAVWLLAVSAPAAGAQDPAAVRAAAERFLSMQAGGQAPRIVVEVTPPRAPLADCAALDAFQMPGSRPIGKITVGVRCLAPARWTVYLQARVQAIGPYAATVRALPPRHEIAAADLVLREGDLGALPADVARDLESLIGQRTVSGVAAGAPLRTGLLRTPLVVRQGVPTRLLLQGPGFSVRGSGLALANAGQGETVRVKTRAGQVVSGIARAGQEVEVAF